GVSAPQRVARSPSANHGGHSEPAGATLAASTYATYSPSSPTAADVPSTRCSGAPPDSCSPSAPRWNSPRPVSSTMHVLGHSRHANGDAHLLASGGSICPATAVAASSRPLAVSTRSHRSSRPPVALAA